MSVSLPEFQVLERKDIDLTHELLKLRQHQGGLFALFMTAKKSQSGAVFGGHNWEEIGRHPALINEYFEQINSQEDFVDFSVRIRRELQALIEGGR